MLVKAFSFFLFPALQDDPNARPVPDFEPLPDPANPGKFLCPECNASRETTTEVLRHHYVEHNKDPCAECEEHLHPLHMAKHVQFMHKAPKYKCKHCDKSFR